MITIRVPASERARIRAAAASMHMSMNHFCKEVIAEYAGLVEQIAPRGDTSVRYTERNHDGTRAEVLARRQRFLEMKVGGMTLGQIAAKEGLSAERVRQIVAAASYDSEGTACQSV